MEADAIMKLVEALYFDGNSENRKNVESAIRSLCESHARLEGELEGQRNQTLSLAEQVEDYRNEKQRSLSDNHTLRYLLWVRHCSSDGKYGDDGELQCGACRLDFLRDSVEKINARFEENGVERYVEDMRMFEEIKALKAELSGARELMKSLVSHARRYHECNDGPFDMADKFVAGESWEETDPIV